MFDFEEELKKLPKKPGVYIMHDADDAIIYIGKAVNLYNRVHSYFREGTKRAPQINKMVTLIARFEYIVTDSDLEAFVLENNLIKEHKPKYNTLLKDDKTYPFIKVTIQEDFPRVFSIRTLKKDKAKYFGPYTSNGAVKDTIELLNKLYNLRTCNRVITDNSAKERPCLNYYMKQCSAPCNGLIDKEAYRKKVNEALDFLKGDYGKIITDLQTKMTQASDEEKYEEAIKYRDLLDSVKAIAQRQKITDYEGEDKDVIALAKEEDDAVVQIFFVRAGKLIGREHYHMTQVQDQEPAEIMGCFVKQFYAGTPYIPKEIMLQYEIEEIPLIEQWLSAHKEAKVYIRIPKIGIKEKLIELAITNAKLVLNQDLEKIKREEGKTIGAVREIGELIDIPSIVRMEAFDISNISGYQTVGSMIVYENGKPKRSDYRKFKIKSVSGPDDYACMHEVLSRRFQHGLEEKKELQSRGVEEIFGSFTKFPDLLLMDGGKGQVNIALQVLEELHINIPVCGMVKDDNHRTRGLYYQNTEIPISRDSEGFKLITRIQDEAHRFAIEFHRSLRSKEQIHSILDDIPGIGPSRKRALMKYFEGIEEIRNASQEELQKVPGIPEKQADEIFNFFHKD